MGATYDDFCVPNLFRLLYQFDPQEPARKKRRLIIIKYVEDDADIDGAATVAASVDVSERQMVRIGSFLLGLDATVRCALCRDTQLPRTETQCALPNALHLGKSDWHWLPIAAARLKPVTLHLWHWQLRAICRQQLMSAAWPSWVPRSSCS